MKLRLLRPGLYEFWCPGCEDHHHIRTEEAPTWGRDLTTKEPYQVCWRFNGDMDKPTFSPSMKLTTQVGQGRAIHVCHVAIHGGMLEYFAATSHGLAKKFIPMTELE